MKIKFWTFFGWLTVPVPVLWLSLLLVLMLPAAVRAQFACLTNDHTLTVTGYTGPGGAVFIPERIDELAVTGIGPFGFNRCTNLTSITIPNSITSIGQGAFSGCDKLSSVRFGSGVTTIANVAFSGCSSLAALKLPGTLTSIEEGAFDRCASLSHVAIPRMVRNIGDNAFGWCANLVAIDVDPLNENYRSADGVLFDKALTTLSEYPGGKKGAYSIPKGVTKVQRLAFQGCQHLRSVAIPNTVTHIGRAAFGSCVGLTSVTVPESVTRIERSTFAACHALTNITIGNGVTIIEVGAFMHCRELAQITIPANVTSIRSAAFLGCTNLSALYFEGNAPESGNEVFGRSRFDSAQPNGVIQTKAYFRSGTAGWGDTWAGCPTVINKQR